MPTQVLFVEDDRIDRMALKRFIEVKRLPLDFEIAESAGDARARLAHRRYDVVVTDFNLGDGTCFDIFDSIVETPFVVLTGGGSEELAVEAIRCGAADYLVKDPERRYLAFLPSVIESAIHDHAAAKRLRLLQEALNNIQDSVYITDLDTNVVYANHALFLTYGYEEAEILGKSSRIFWDNAVHDEGELAEKDVYHRKKDGTAFPVELSKSAVKDSQGNEVNFITVVHDITDRKKMETALMEAIEKYSTLLDRAEARDAAGGK